MRYADGRANNSPDSGKPIELPDGYDWAAFLRRHARRIRFRNDGCWEWRGATFRGGYGALSLNAVRYRAHRVSWSLLVGPLPAGLTLDHLCRRTSCLNPDHMELVTAGENRRRAPLSGWAQIHAAKTTCSKGHPLDKQAAKQRLCSVCRRTASRRYAQSPHGKAMAHANYLRRRSAR